MLGMDNQITGNIFHVINTILLTIISGRLLFFNVVRNGQ